MKPHLLLVTLLTTTAAWAQQPTLGFSRKLKLAAPTVDVAARLNALKIKTPTDKTSQQTFTTTNRSSLKLDPLRVHIVRDISTGLPVFIERTSSQSTIPAVSAKNAGARQSAVGAASATFQFMGQVRDLLKLANPTDNFTVSRTETDELGQMHVRLTQTHRGIPVLGSEMVAHLTNGEVTLLNGRYRPVADGFATVPTLNITDASTRALSDVRKTSTVRSFGDNLLKLKSSEGELCIFPTEDGGHKLAYSLTVRPNMLERWEYVVDAQTGEILDKYNHTCSFAGPVTATARDLNGVTRSLKTYQQNANTYYLIDTSRPMYNGTTSKLPDNPIGAIWTIDARNTYGDKFEVYQVTSTNNTTWNPTAVSAHFNAGTAYDYYRTTFNRNALTGTGETIVSMINMTEDDGSAMDNAYWNGKFMAYGNGNKLFKPLAGALDVAGHEMTHGVISNSANLQYKAQSGAINESFADVFGVLIDRDDWQLGEDVLLPGKFPSGAIRDVSNPNQGQKSNGLGYQPATMAQYVTTNSDNGGVHINSGIPNFAFYKFASVVGKEKAEQVYYRALTKYLVRTSQFLDLRLAIIKSAGDLYGANGTEVTAAKNAFDAVGITESTTGTPDKQPDTPTATGQDMILVVEASSSKLYSTTANSSSASFDPKSTLGLVHRPSVTADGKTAYYVTSDKRIRAVNLTGTPNETIISNETIWDNVAISRDGTKLAGLTADHDGSIYVYSYAKQQWAQFKLYNPTYAEGVKTGEVQYADSFEWDFTGENIVYDAYNALKNNSGANIDYWDVGFINVWSNNASDFAKGEIEKLFSSLDEGESIGNPSFSKNSPDVIAFDYVNDLKNVYEVVAVDLSTGKGNVVYENNTLGFPSYSRLDNTLIFSTESNGKDAVSGIGLAADKISPSGNASVLYTGAKWAVWYTQTTKSQPTKAIQTITFDAIADRYTNQGDLLLKATCSSNLTVGFQVKSGPATLSGNSLKFTGTGKVTIQAYQNGNDQFAAANPVERSFNVLTVTAVEPTLNETVIIYPNPVVNTLTVELPTTETIEQLSVVSLSGATISQPTLGVRQHTATVDLSNLNKGVYMLRIQTPHGTASRKVIKE